MKRLRTAVAAVVWLGWSGSAAAAFQPTAQPTMSLASIIGDATPTVKAVITFLLLISIASWTVLALKSLQLLRLFRHTQHAEDRLTLAADLDTVVEVRDMTVIAMVEAARDEVERSRMMIAGGFTEGVNARVGLMLDRVEEEAARRIGEGVGLFATAATVTPFIGLFGTVWGIMHSFIGIAQANNTSLSVVAPGIAEALLATAVGLGVAIPATVMYNVIGNQISEYRSRLSDCSVRITCLVSRDAERSQLDRHENLSADVGGA